MSDANDSADHGAHFQSASSTRPISPPPLKRKREKSPSPAATTIDSVSSPFQLTHIRDLSSENNVDTVSLKDILGDPLITECWEFNYLHDVEFLMSAFDEDVRDTVQVYVVHGSWKQEDSNRQAIEEAARRHPNVTPVAAYMPEPFGTHHTKMLILFKNDDTSQIVVSTANMIKRDWTNMTQAVWRSPFLPLLDPQAVEANNDTKIPVGSGARFKFDLLNYLGAYGARRTGKLVQKLANFDFSGVRASLVASVPIKQRLSASKSRNESIWGWQGLRETLRGVPCSLPEEKPTIVMQVSSIASLGATDKWLGGFFNVLASSCVSRKKKPNYKIIFPTADEIRRSLDGYASGASIHTKLHRPAQQKQLDYLRSRLCYWAGDGDGIRSSESSASPQSIREAGRRRAAPHIKTYICFVDGDMTKIDWAMITSANLSKQAWGELENKDDEVRICSYELGVLVWPALVTGAEATEENTQGLPNNGSIMVPTFKTDSPSEKDVTSMAKSAVGFRMPYDLPLVPYQTGELPWCATATYTTPDWKGRTWTSG